MYLFYRIKIYMQKNLTRFSAKNLYKLILLNSIYDNWESYSIQARKAGYS